LITKYGPRQAAFPLDPGIIGRTHSWPTYNLRGKPKLSNAEKEGLTFGVYENGKWSYDGRYVNPEDVNDGSVKLVWSYDPNISDWHGAVDLVPKRGTERPIRVRCILKGKVVRVSKTSSGYCNVWVESSWGKDKLLFVYQHLDDRYLPHEDETIKTGNNVGHLGYLKTQSGADRSHLHLEVISKKKFAVPENMRVVCDEATGLRSQFDYERLAAVGYRGAHYMYNGVFMIDFTNGLITL
jgi:hypothetical protein